MLKWLRMIQAVELVSKIYYGLETEDSLLVKCCDMSMS